LALRRQFARLLVEYWEEKNKRKGYLFIFFLETVLFVRFAEKSRLKVLFADLL
jgi:hypothetical protein